MEQTSYGHKSVPDYWQFQNLSYFTSAAPSDCTMSDWVWLLVLCALQMFVLY